MTVWGGKMIEEGLELFEKTLFSKKGVNNLNDRAVYALSLISNPSKPKGGKDLEGLVISLFSFLTLVIVV